MKTIYISDTSLKDNSSARGQALLFREKTAMVKVIDALGVDALELPPIKNLSEDRIIDKTIASVLQNAALVLPSGAQSGDPEKAWSCICSAKKPRLQISLPVSTVQMEYMFRLKNAGMLEKIAQLCAEAAALSPSVEFEALDAARAERSFLTEACRTAEQNGADVITLVDETGETLPEEFGEMVKDVRAVAHGRLLVAVSDKMGLAVSCLAAALRAGADGVKASVDKEDALTLERISDLAGALGDKLGFSARLDGTAIHTGVKTLLKDLRKEPMQEIPGTGDARSIVLDGGSSPAQVREAAFALGYDLGEEDVGKVTESLHMICKKKGSVGAKEFEAIIASSAMQVPSTYHLESYTATSGNMTQSLSQVTLRRDGERISGVASGDGPIDAAFLALENCIGHHYELDDFEIQSVTEGKEALGSALVKLRHEGRLYSGNGLSTDIVGASIRAYINALNKIVYEE